MLDELATLMWMTGRRPTRRSLRETIDGSSTRWQDLSGHRREQRHRIPKRVALWASHYAHVTWPNAWHGDLHVYGHSHGSIPATRTSLDVGVDRWDWH
jgi:hypothetical protein